MNLALNNLPRLISHKTQTTNLQKKKQKKTNANEVVMSSFFVLYTHLHVHAASQRHNIKDRRMNKRRMIKTQEEKHRKKRRKKTSLE